MVVFLIFVYLLFGFFTYSSLSFHFNWPDIFDMFDKHMKDQKAINRLVLTWTFWPLVALYGVFLAIYWVFKAVFWFLKNLVIASIDVFKTSSNYVKKIKQ